jgi:hypothetical protein
MALAVACDRALSFREEATLALASSKHELRHSLPERGWRGVAVALAAAVAAGIAALAAAHFMLPQSHVFPVVAAGLIVAAATMALIAWGAPREVGAVRTVYWDIAGALTLIGLAAALFGEPEQAVALLERERI